LDLEVSRDHNKLEHAEEVDGKLLESRPNAPPFFHPAHASLDDIAAAIGLGIKPRGSFLPLLMRGVGDDCPDSPASKPGAHPPIGISFVAGQTLRTPAGRTYPLRNPDGV
jgi:hypothetical protein